MFAWQPLGWGGPKSYSFPGRDDRAHVHHDHRRSFERVVLAGFAPHQRPVAYLYILQMNRRGILQILLSGLGLHDSSGIGYGYSGLGSRIGLQSDRIATDGS